MQNDSPRSPPPHTKRLQRKPKYRYTHISQIFIVGFSGSIVCPRAKEFCQYEKPSGAFNAATDPIVEWIFLACCIVIPLTVFCCCKCHPSLWSNFNHYLDKHHGIGDLHAMWGIVLNDIGLARLSSHPRTLQVIAINVCLLMSTLEFFLAVFTLMAGVWLVRLTVFMLGAYLLHISWAGIQGARGGRPSAHLIWFVYGNMAISTFFWLFGMGAFLYPEIMREFTLTFGDSLLPDDIDQRIAVLGCLLLTTFAVQCLGMIFGMVMLGHRVVAHANLILVNVLLFVLAVYGASYFGGQALKLGWLYAVLTITPGVMVPLHTMWGTYSVRYKSVFALNVYKWMSFINLGVLGVIAVISFGYANSEYVRLSGLAVDGSASSEAMANAASDADIEALVLKIYKAMDKCPPFRGTCRNAIAWSSYNSLIFCGMYALMHACLLALCAFAAFHLHAEKSMAEELVAELSKHPSHANARAFVLAKKLVEQGSTDGMAYADEGGGETEDMRRRMAQRKLASMFKGYRLKTLNGTVSSIHMTASTARMTIPKTKAPPQPTASSSGVNIEMTQPSN